MTSRSAAPAAWQEMVALGEKLLQAEGLAGQCNCICETTAELLKAEACLWLDEQMYRLPGSDAPAYFHAQPPDPAMVQAFTRGEVCYLEVDGRSQVAAPLRYQDIFLGVLQISRPMERKFRKPELDMFIGLAGHIGLALYTARRVAVEQWRLEQLNLVRRVSAQIASVLDLDILTRRVTDLILETFQYYFVAIFTLEPGQSLLRFRSSAGPRGRRKRKKAISPLAVELGQGLVGLAAQNGEEFVVSDVRAEPRFRFIDVLPETQSEVVLPLKIENQVLGVLDIQSEKLDAFHPNDLLVLRALADAIATAVNAARLYSDVQKRAEQLAVVAEVSDDINKALDLEVLFAQVAKLIHERLGFPHVHLLTVHPNRRQIIYEAGSGTHNSANKGTVMNLDTAEGLIPWVARNGETVLANDVTLEPRYVSSPFPPQNTRAELAVPLIYDNKVVGVLDLQSNETGAFLETDVFLFEALADSIATAIHNADLYHTERWRRQVADSLREVAGLVSADVSLDDVLDAVLRELERNLPCEVSAVWLLDGDSLYLAHVRGADPVEIEAVAQRWPEAYDYLASTLVVDLPVIRQPADPFGPTGTMMGYAADYSSIAAALRVGDQPLGVLTLTHHTAGRYGHEAQAITATFANYAAVAIENARMYDTAQEQAYASATLLHVAQTVANSTGLDETLESIVRVMPMLVGVHGCAVYLLGSQHLMLAKAYGISEDLRLVLADRPFQPGEFPLLDAVREQGSMIIGLIDAKCRAEDCLLTDLALTDDEILYALQAGDRMLLGFPLMIRGDLYGVMLVEETGEARRFRNKRVEIIHGVAQQIAIAIQNEHLKREMVVRERLEHEVQLARQIQQTFLPDHLPELPGWELQAEWITARQVGGDFYDVFELPGRRLGLFIADVSDKGIPAALFMALTRTLVRAVVFDTDSPAEALRRVNELIRPDNQQEMFVTAVYAVLSLEGGELTYANAGHNPPLWFNRPDGNVERLTRTGAALGVIDKMEMEERTIHFLPGCGLLLYTDGLTEAFSPDGKLFGEERLLQVLVENAAAPATELLQAINASVEAFMDTEPAADDLTMLVLRRAG
ncbi:MAG: GAF domain-containing protein [Anaerolineales bacterium]|nr:GAF domain-containing protein [Anaerolineales bacterium]